MYQHLTQRAYLERWNISGKIYLIDKNSGKTTEHQSAKTILGMENVQTEEMEKAFQDLEAAVGFSNHPDEITELKKIITFTRWLALHAVRCKRHAPLLKNLDYQKAVEHLAEHLANHFAYFIDFKNRTSDASDNIFITCDNPCVQLSHNEIEFWIIPLYPSRLVVLSPMDARLEKSPWQINQEIARAATDHCVSFDRSLHTQDPRLAAI